MIIKLKKIKQNINLEKIQYNSLVRNEFYIGGQKARWNPLLVGFLYKIRKGMLIINLEYTIFQIKNGLNLIKNIVRNRGKIMILVLKKKINNIVKILLTKNKQGYVVYKYSHGSLMRFRRMRRLFELKRMGYLIGKLRPITFLKLKGYVALRRPPALLVLTTGNKQEDIYRESLYAGIRVLSFIDTNTMTLWQSHTVVGNSKTNKNINLILLLINYAIFFGIKNESKFFIKNQVVNKQILQKLKKMKRSVKIFEKYKFKKFERVQIEKQPKKNLIKRTTQKLKKMNYALKLKFKDVLKQVKKGQKNKIKVRRFKKGQMKIKTKAQQKVTKRKIK
uniref:Ribosomal protein S2 n=1 Tax=Cavenderia fasciculata TaxID=261658 RepID=B2XXA9_CACFS|nr:ribosomal protein S2 [Cavenderia fasciculata]ABX45231.1 ribosomal protein S2 [Cavenderia fasciculata]